MRRRSCLVVLVFLSALAAVHAQTTDFLTLVKTATPQNVQDALDKGASVKAIDSVGRTPLMMAAEYNPDPAVVRALLTAGADINAQDTCGGNCLFYATGKPLDVVTMLLSFGADPNAGSSDGETPFMNAASHTSNPEEIAALLKAGADINSRDTNGLTPLMYAAAGSKSTEVIAALLKAGADINARDLGSRTALMLAAKSNPMPEVVQALLDAGSAVESRDLMGRSALMIAAGANNPRVVIALLKAGGDCKAKDKADKTAFDYARSNYGLQGTDAYRQLKEASQ